MQENNWKISLHLNNITSKVKQFFTLFFVLGVDTQIQILNLQLLPLILHLLRWYSKLLCRDQEEELQNREEIQ